MHQIAPKFVTKFFRAADRKHFARGTFRFGSLADYRSQEKAKSSDRFGDDAEGKGFIFTDYFYSHGKTTILGITMMPGSAMMNFSIEYPFLEYAFCTSIGDYDLDRHKLMIENQSSTSPEDLLTDYCVIDVEKFLKAMDAIARRSDTKIQGLERTRLFGAVSYGDRNIDMSSLGSPSKPDAKYSIEQIWDRTIFTKPERFSHEKEFRILAPFHSGKNITRSENQILIESYAMRRSIKKFGRHNFNLGNV